MSVKITLEFASTEAAITALAAVRSAEGKSDPKPEAAAPAPTPPKKDKAVASSPTAAAAPTAAPATPPAASPAPAPAAADAYAPVGKAIAAKVAEGHKVLAVALLAKFGAKSGKDLKPEQYEAFTKELAEVGMESDIA